MKNGTCNCYRLMPRSVSERFSIELDPVLPLEALALFKPLVASAAAPALVPALMLSFALTLLDFKFAFEEEFVSVLPFTFAFAIAFVTL